MLLIYPDTAAKKDRALNEYPQRDARRRGGSNDSFCTTPENVRPFVGADNVLFKTKI